MEKLISDMNVLSVKIRNYHYNVIGTNFVSAHVALDAEYNTFSEWIDMLSERMKMNEKFPPASMKNFLEVSTIKEVESREYTIKEAFSDLLNDYENLIKTIKSVSSDTVTASILEDIQKELEKKIWFFKSSLK